METIKISVEVNVNLSEATQKFLTALFANAHRAANIVVDCDGSKEATVNVEDEKKPTTTAPAAAPAQTKQDAKPAPSVAAAPAASSTASSASKGIEDVRKLLAAKVNTHRDAIKQKLTDLGAPSVTKLDPAKYDEMYDFLNSL